MKAAPTRSELFPEAKLPDAGQLIAEGREQATRVMVQPCAFIDHYAVACESDYKRRCMAEARLMLHAQIGYRDLRLTQRAAVKIYASLAERGYRVDRYGICLDWSMGYPRHRRAGKPRGTGLVLNGIDEFAELTASAPVAPHFGDFVVGTPASMENTQAALAAGATTIGNLGQYFTFRQPHWDDDVHTTAETLKALALIAAQPVEVLVHSNLDDGYASTFSDLSCVAGMVLVEQHIVCGLLGGRIAHCYGHTFSDPLTRFAFQRMLAAASETPGSMVYGNTTSYGESPGENFAALASYLLLDAAAQKGKPSGHALNPVPVTEAERIPEIEEIIDAHVFANALLGRFTDATPGSIDVGKADRLGAQLLKAGRVFKQRLFESLTAAGIDTENAFEMLLALRRLGARRLEALAYRPPVAGRAEILVAPSPFRQSLDQQIRAGLQHIDEPTRQRVAEAGFTACVASSDVHEYGKLLVEALLERAGVKIIDGGVSVDPDELAETAHREHADFIALSTYNGVALDFARALVTALSARTAHILVFIGGKLNQIPEDSNSAMPVDVAERIAACGAIPCRSPKDMFRHLAAGRVPGRR